MKTLTIETALCGIHPRSEQTVKASRDFEKGRGTQDELGKVLLRDAKELISLERRHKISKISDGQLKWQDPIRPLAELVKGLEISADLSRWFDTNTFYKKPTVVGELKIASESKVLAKLSEKVSAGSLQRGKIIFLPGPYTLASLVDDKFYSSKLELISEFSRIIGEVVSVLAYKGISCFQFNEPSLVYRPYNSKGPSRRELDAYFEAHSRYLSELPAEIRVHTYFGNASHIIPFLVNLKGIDAIGIDFTQTALGDLKKGALSGKTLGVGCIDSRNSLVEDAAWIADFAAEAAKKLDPEGLVILPSSDLKYLPRRLADEKLEMIALGADLLRKR